MSNAAARWSVMGFVARKMDLHRQSEDVQGAVERAVSLAMEHMANAPLSPAHIEDGESEHKAPLFGILAGEPEIIGQRCADGGICHNRCKTECFRKYGCVPLSGSGLRDDWSAPPAAGVPGGMWSLIEATVRGAFSDGAKDYRGCMHERLRELKDALAAPTPPASEQQRAVVMPENLETHRASWRGMFLELIERTSDSVDRSYYQHELRALDAMYADVDRLRALLSTKNAEEGE